jgi:hypothetical protein
MGGETMFSRRFPAAWLVVGGAIWSVAAQQPSGTSSAIRVAITPPQGQSAGKLVVVMAKAKLLEEVRNAIPEAIPLPDQKLGNQLSYHDVQLNKVKVKDVRPSSLRLEGDVFHVAGTPTVTGELNALYEHVVIKTEVKTVGKFLGREIKVGVPVVKRDWRPMGAAPFDIRVEVRGTAKLSFGGVGTLKDGRVHVETRADHVKITDVRLRTDNRLYRFVKDLVVLVGKAFPNEGLNKPIKNALTRDFDIDPFQGLAAKDRDQLGTFMVKNVTIATTDSDVKVSADLILR